MNRTITYRGIKPVLAGWNVVETIDCINVVENTTFMLDVTIQSGNGNNILECCSIARYISSYKFAGGTPVKLSTQTFFVVSNNTIGGNSISLVDGIDYQEVINGSNQIEIQIDRGSAINTDVSYSIIFNSLQ